MPGINDSITVKVVQAVSKDRWDVTIRGPGGWGTVGRDLTGPDADVKADQWANTLGCRVEKRDR